jgi:hypothetical protein
MFITGVNDTGEKLFSGVNDTGEKFIARVVDTGDKFITHLDQRPLRPSKLNNAVLVCSSFGGLRGL